MLASLLRALYRILIKNKVIRWAWLLAIAVWGVYYTSENWIAKQYPPQLKTIFSTTPNDVVILALEDNTSEMTFTKTDSGWLAEKNNITVWLHQDSVDKILRLVERVESNILSKTGSEPYQTVKMTFTTEGGKSSALLVHFTADSTFVQLPERQTWYAVTGQWRTILTKNFDNFRDKTLVDIARSAVRNIIIKNPTDTTMILAKDSSWLSNDRRFTINQKVFSNYVAKLLQLRGQFFYDKPRDFMDAKYRQHQIVIRSTQDSVVLTAYRLQNGFALHSTQNESAVFQTDSVKHLFLLPSEYLIKKKL